MKDIYVAVFNQLDNEHADLHVYYIDGSETVYHLPEEKSMAKAIVKSMAKQYEVNDDWETLEKEGMFIRTTPDNFDEIKENIEFSSSYDMEYEESFEDNGNEKNYPSVILDDSTSRMEDEEEFEDNSSEKNYPSVVLDNNTSGTDEEEPFEQAEIEEFLEGAGIHAINFGVIKLNKDGIPSDFYAFNRNGDIYSFTSYDVENDDSILQEFSFVLMQMALQEGIKFDFKNFSTDTMNQIQDELLGHDIISVYESDEFDELYPYMVNANNKMNEDIQRQENETSPLPPLGGQSGNGEQNENTSQKVYTKAEQKAYAKFQKEMEKQQKKYYKKVAKAKAKEEENRKLAAMSKKERRQYKTAKVMNMAKNIAGKIPVIGKLVNNNQPKKKGSILRRVTRFVLIVITTAVVGIIGLFSKDFSNMMKKGFSSKDNLENQLNNLNKSNTNNNKNNTKNKNNKKKYKNIKDALVNANINDSKKNAISGVSSFLRDYNTSIAKDYSKGKTKLAHTWNEVMSFYLGVNNIGQQKINDIFDGCRLDASKFLDAFKKGVQQEVQAYIVSNASLEKEQLIENEKGQMFLVNYEKLKNKLKSITDNSDITRECVANQFYEKVRKDYLSNSAEMKAYKAAALPIIQAMNILTEDLHFENKLSQEEIKEINQKVYSDVSKRLKKYENNLAAHIKANGVTTDDELSYNELKSLVVSELQGDKSYTITAKKRNITGQKNYKVAVNKVRSTTVENNNSNNSNKSEESEKQETPKKQKKYKVTVKKKASKKNSNASKIMDWNVGQPTEDVILDSNDNITINNFQPSTDDSSFGQDYFDNILNPDDNPIDNGTIDDPYQDDNGNLDNSVKDPTTDSTGAVSGDTALPDPNAPDSEQITENQNSSSANEVIADQIVEDMANDQASSTDSIKVFYKK